MDLAMVAGHFSTGGMVFFPWGQFDQMLLFEPYRGTPLVKPYLPLTCASSTLEVVAYLPSNDALLIVSGNTPACVVSWCTSF